MDVEIQTNQLLFGPMIILIELLTLCLFTLLTYCLFKYSLFSFLRVCFCYSIGLFIASLTFKVSAFIFDYLLENIFLQSLISFLISFTAFTLIVLRLYKVVKLKEGVVLSAGKKIIYFKLFILLALLSIFLMASVSIVNILSADPDFYESLKRDSLFCSLLLPDQSDNKEDDFWSEVKSGISESTGSKNFSDNIRALNFILTLESHEYSELVNENDALKTLLKEPALKAIEEDTALMELFIEEDMSLAKVYSLAENKKVKALLEDENFLQSVRQIDLLELEKQILKIRFSKLNEFRPACYTLGIESSLMLDESLKNGAWTLCSGDTFTLTEGKYSLLKIPLQQPGIVRFQFKSEKAPIVIYRNESDEMVSHGDVLVFELETLEAEDIVFMFEFSEKSLRQIKIQAFYKKSED